MTTGNLSVKGNTQTGLSKAQLTSIIVASIVDIILAVTLIQAYNVVLAPVWGGQKRIELAFSWIAGAAILLMPTIAILSYGWKEKITSQAYRLPLRMGFAFFFLKVGFDKVLNPAFFKTPGSVTYAMYGNPNTYVRGALTAISAYEVPLLYLAGFGEALIGISMLLGIFTRLGGVSSAIMLLIYTYAFGFVNSAVYGINLWGSLAAFDLAMSRSGRYIGLDQFLGPRFDRSKNPFLRVVGLILT